MPEHLRPRAKADSAGQSFEGRTFQAHDTTYADDDGTADPRVLVALEALRAGTGTEVDVLEALRGIRLLIPLLAHAGDEGVNEHGVTVDKTQELAIVTVQGPDGRAVLPAFTSVTALRAWDPRARPVPAESRRVAIAAVSESTELMVLDPGSPTEFGVRRPALWALAQDLPWVPAHLDAEVGAAFLEAAAGEDAVESVGLAPGAVSPALVGPELVVQLVLRPGLDQEGLAALVGRLQARWTASEVIATRVDSMAVRVVAAR
ncbi:SseB family protein [Frondihabitans cladoniiphilus]|uniref:SseB family protein n=1 Tax=Frondihabitans cladoniiphilus TaxID=715785 RepID=UPI0031E60D54